MAVLDKDRADRIRQCLRGHARGLTITDIVRQLKVNRNTVAKYLDMLFIAGEVEMQEIGPSKVYYLSRRVPVSAMLEFSSECIVVTDADQRIIRVNEPVVRLLNAPRENLVGNSIRGSENPFLSCLPVPDEGNVGEPARERITDASCTLHGKVYHFRIKLVPTVFENGSLGATYIMEDITGKKEAEARIAAYVRNLEFLARTSAEFADMGDGEDIYQYIADRIIELEPKGFVNLMTINPDTKMTSLRAVAGNREISRILLENFGAFFEREVYIGEEEEAYETLSKGVLVGGNQKSKMNSLYEQTYHVLPEHVCSEIEKQLKQHTAYAMGCTCRLGLYGNIMIRFRENDDLTNRETVEAFVRQAGIALQRRHLREKLRKAEEQIRLLESRLSPAGPDNPVSRSRDGN